VNIFICLHGVDSFEEIWEETKKMLLPFS